MPRRPPAVARVLERVTATVRDHTMLRPGERVLLSVSGGPDSTCLLYSLHMLRRLFKVQLEVFHFDHRLRPDSAKDADYVRRLSERLKLPFNIRSAIDAPRKGDSVEDWARGARGRGIQDVFTSRTGTDRWFARFATGHTMDDHAETVLLALMRGGGLESITGIEPKWGPLIHPLVEVRREEVLAFVRALGLRPRQDPSNRDTRLMRNALRLKGMPALERAVGRDIVEPIARSASLLQVDEDFIRRSHMDTLKELGLLGMEFDRLPVEPLRKLHRGMASRLVRDMLVKALPTWPEQAHVDAVLDLVKGPPGRRIDLPGGLSAVREKEYVRLSRPSPERDEEGRPRQKGE